MLLARHAAAVQACYGLQKFNSQLTVPASGDASYEASRREVDAGINKLRPIWRIADLRMTVHRDNYIIVRTISEPIKMTALSFVIEDVQGAATRLSIYSFTEEARFPRLCQQFPEGTIWLVKAPFFKVAADGGRVIRVENPSNIIRLSPSDPLLAETPWYQPPTSGGPATRADAGAASAAAAGAGAAGAGAAAAEAPDAARLRMQGNEHFKRGQLDEAMARYRAAVAAEPSDHLSWGNMAQVELQQADRARERAKFEAARAHYAAALEHARMSVVIEPSFVKSAVRHARALMGLGRYAVANALVDEQMVRLDAPREGPLDVRDNDAVAVVHAELVDRLGLPRSGLKSFASALSKLPPTAGTGGAAAAAGAAGARKAPAAGGSTAAAAAAAASNVCEPADSFPGEMAEELRQRGNALFRRGAFAAAAAAYRGALGHVPAHPITCSNLAECELRMADAACSTAASTKAKGGAGGEAAGAAATAVAATASAAASPAAQRHYAVALACADMALAGAPDHAKSANRRARALLGLGRSDEAAAQLRAGLAMLSSAASAAAAPPAGSAELATVMRHLLATLQPVDAASVEPAVGAARADATARASAEAAAAAGAGAGGSAPTAARTAPAASAARAPTSAAARSRAARRARSNVAEFAHDEEEGEELPKLAASSSSATGKLSARGAAAAAAALQTCEVGPGTLNVAETPGGCSASGITDGCNTSEVSEGYRTNAPEVAEGYCTNAPETPGTVSEAAAE